jgi:hypothetical protein
VSNIWSRGGLFLFASHFAADASTHGFTSNPVTVQRKTETLRYPTSVDPHLSIGAWRHAAARAQELSTYPGRVGSRSSSRSRREERIDGKVMLRQPEKKQVAPGRYFSCSFNKLHVRKPGQTFASV